MKIYWKVTLWYLVFGVSWIFISDELIARYASDIHVLTTLQTAKGWLYVVVSGMLIYELTKRSFEAHLARDRERRLLFEKTLEGSHHILLNYLNQMQVVTMEAERCQDFDKRTIALARELGAKAADELRKLNDLEILTSENIDSMIYRDLRKN